MASDSTAPSALSSTLPDFWICDAQFMFELERVKKLRSFLDRELTVPGHVEDLSLGELNLLMYHPRGRGPSLREWDKVEHLRSTLLGVLTEPLRRKFVMGEVPRWLAYSPIALALMAIGSLLVASSIYGTTRQVYTLPCFLVWLASLGAMGAVAFVGMNALSVQHDITFDINNHTLMVLRIILGALFGLVLSLPFGAKEFLLFVQQMSGPASAVPPAAGGGTRGALVLLSPFLLGFSTSLVIMVLNRLVGGVQAFFGQTVAAAGPVLASNFENTRQLHRNSTGGGNNGMRSGPMKLSRDGGEHS